MLSTLPTCPEEVNDKQLLSAKWSLSFRFPPEALYTFLFSPIRVTCPAHLILIDLITLIILALQIMKLFIMQFSPVPSSFSSKHPALGHQQPVICNLHNTSLSVRRCAYSPLQLTIIIIAILKQICSPSGQPISAPYDPRKPKNKLRVHRSTARQHVSHHTVSRLY